MYEGAFSDGKTAVRREVRVEVTRSRLIIIGEEEAALDEWSIEGLRVADAIHGAGQPIHLAHRDHGEARLAEHGVGGGVLNEHLKNFFDHHLLKKKAAFRDETIPVGKTGRR